jgi:hypothetical protein
MGSASAKAAQKTENDVLRNARSVLSRRGSPQNDPGILGISRNRMIPESYDEKLMGDMSQVLNIKTSYDLNVNKWC